MLRLLAVTAMTAILNHDCCMHAVQRELREFWLNSQRMVVAINASASSSMLDVRVTSRVHSDISGPKLQTPGFRVKGLEFSTEEYTRCGATQGSMFCPLSKTCLGVLMHFNALET